MKFSKSVLSLIIALFLFSITSLAEDMKPGDVIEGFRLTEKRFVKEVNSECLYFIHEKSGARLLKINSKDDNKTFAIAFKTDPESDCGTPHIIEHSVLNGSKSFPVKSPYDVLRKGSLLTFINAFTGSDMTCFPVASKNNKDYFNLMHVYLDAVFEPNFRTDVRILKQEGWHHEMENIDGPVTYKGVVYNEMKGAYSSPMRELSYIVQKSLFPDNGYRYSSGGYPKDIPKLTQEMFVKYHEKYYHPSNSYILLYGDADLKKELGFINEKYLSKFNKAVPPVTFPMQKPLAAMKELTGYYSITEGADTKDQTYLSYSVVAGKNTDRALVMGLNTLADVLVNQEAAPIRLALQNAGIGKEVEASVDDMQQNVFQILVQNANPADKDKFLQIVFEQLKIAAEKGLDKKAVEGSLNRAEFALREGNSAQKGLNYAFQILPGWFFADNPFLTLEYEKPLAKVKTALTGDYLENIIKEQILNNTHSVLAILEPRPGYEKELNSAIQSELEAYKNSLNDEAKKKLVDETKELVAHQKRQDTPEALATVPMLERKDINPNADWYELNEKQAAGVKLLSYEAFSENVVYTRLIFDMHVLPQELLPYASLLTEILGSQNTKNYTYGELDNELNINTGGFSSFINTYAENQDDDKLIPKFIVSTKSMKDKTDKMLSLIGEIINNTKLNDLERLKAIINRYQSRIDAQVRENGLNYAQIRTLSYFTNMGMFNELIGGIDYYWFITDLSRNFDTRSGEIIANLTKTAGLLFNRKNMVVAVTGSSEDIAIFAKQLENFIPTIPDREVKPNKWNFVLAKKNEGLQTSSKVQYVIKGFNIKKLGYSWDGKMKVLNQIISRDWLHNRIRVIGGAYGGFSSLDEMGNFVFMSYRDPNLKETLDNYNSSCEYLDKLELTEKDITRYIIGTISGMDAPLTVSQKGNTAVSNYFNKVTREQVSKTRSAVLNTSLSDIKSFSSMLKTVLEQNAYCVYGNDEKINSNKDLFGTTLKIIK